MTARKSLDAKLEAIRRDPSGPEFILADAKDADMAFGVTAPGWTVDPKTHEKRLRSIQDYRGLIRQIVADRLVDIMLMSASTSEQLTINERIFADSPVTPACRANDAFDVHVVRGGSYITGRPQAFRTASIDHMMTGQVDGERRPLAGADLGLYSVTFNNNTDADWDVLERYREFRHEAERKQFRHFLEVFNPNLAGAVPPEQVPSYVNDMIARTLAGVTERGRPIFLKIVYNGPRAMEELVHYDRNMIVGVLGGSAGTTYDAFKLLAEAQKYGARAALFGRKINQAENQFAFLRFLRLIADRVISPEEAVRAYHAVLDKLGVPPHRSLDEDMTLQTDVMTYLSPRTIVDMKANDSRSRRSAVVTMSHSCTPGTPAKAEGCGQKGACHCGCKKATSPPDFARMTSAERLTYHQQRIGALLGERT